MGEQNLNQSVRSPSTNLALIGRQEKNGLGLRTRTKDRQSRIQNWFWALNLSAGTDLALVHFKLTDRRRPNDITCGNVSQAKGFLLLLRFLRGKGLWFCNSSLRLYIYARTRSHLSKPKTSLVLFIVPPVHQDSSQERSVAEKTRMLEDWKTSLVCFCSIAAWSRQKSLSKSSGFFRRAHEDNGELADRHQPFWSLKCLFCCCCSVAYLEQNANYFPRLKVSPPVSYNVGHVGRKCRLVKTATLVAPSMFLSLFGSEQSSIIVVQPYQQISLQ